MELGWARAAGVAFGWIVVASVAAAETPIVLPRAGQIGLGAGGGYGSFLESGNVGSVFGPGPAFTVKFRYRMRYERAIGMTFESLDLDARQEAPPYEPPPVDNVASTGLRATLSGVEFYQMFDTRERTTKMLSIGAGIAQLRAKLNSGETLFSGQDAGDGLFVSGGGAIERFFYRSLAWDFSARYLAVFREGRANHHLQATLGLIFYASY